jgi:hypothetical protein
MKPSVVAEDPLSLTNIKTGHVVNATVASVTQTILTLVIRNSALKVTHEILRVSKKREFAD